ncbi:cobalamin-binding protein [Pseudoteredinibacter isoporae]|uniref:Iron complex transport system substrate-binding protein n=1 Tax=Pseudoteredinibacter isoporae TaxID=570281 RepID=A0A7X0JQY8_9GAMM|nr:cobalamin-binding protein [Pseudoteredinibacter isoporae]MBB6519776.1 iron complex transport system substrate-binding protein [Pseudoteredinibacter isoporae]NHO85357.1 cobalamin-binding protein [Pseudoteredinibacter isoporae]NIB26191.1 cobalamin-binding protein [Pseudoteredinibacter isoporae]
MKKTVPVVLLWVLLACAFTANAGNNVDTAHQANVELAEKPAKRIVALAPHLVEIAYAVGVGDKLVAAVSYSDFPEAAKNIPRVGNFATINVEAIARLQPDLILAWGSGNPAKSLRKLEDLGFRVYRSEPKSLSDIAKLMNDVARISGHREGLSAAKQYQQKLNKLRQRYQSQSPVTVFYQVWNQPLQTLSDQSIVSDVIKLCGGKNVFGDAPAVAPKVSVETVLRRDPEVIVASGTDASRPKWLDDWKAWPNLQAVKKDQLYFVPPDLIQRHTPRLLQGAEILCKQLAQVRSKQQEI